MTLLAECLNATNVGGCLFGIVTDMVSSGLGGTGTAYLFFYVLMLMLTIFSFTVFKGLVYGAVAGLINHFIIMILGMAGAFPLPSSYYVVGSFTYILLVFAFYQAWRKKPYFGY